MTIPLRVAPDRRLPLLLALSAAFTGCSSTGGTPVTPPPPPPPPAAVASVSLSAPSATLEISGTTTLTATPRDAAGTALSGRTITWSSSAPTVANVANGLVTAVSAGLATITATSEGKSATAQITVNAAPLLSCSASAPTGRLTLMPGGTTYRYITTGGWHVDVKDNWSVIMTHATEPQYKVEIWGTPDSPTSVIMTHENLAGKHIKDRLKDQRSVLLPDGTLVTINASPVPQLGRVSIYGSDQTHRIEVQGFKVTQSCLIGNFGEAEEHDGEASRLRFEGADLWWENTYDQDVGPGGIPGPKVPNLVPLGRAMLPNTVNDYFDDPRLGHT